MLRLAIAAVAALLLLVTVMLALYGKPLFLPGVIWPLLALLGLGFERWRYSATLATVPKAFEPTSERFTDADSGHLIEVYFDPASGERRYVDTGAAP